MASRPCRNSARLRHRLSTVYASATRAGSRVFQASSAMRAFCAAVSAVKGGSGGRLIGRLPFRDNALVHGLAVQLQVEAFALGLVGDAQADDDVDDLEDDQRHD